MRCLVSHRPDDNLLLYFVDVVEDAKVTEAELPNRAELIPGWDKPAQNLSAPVLPERLPTQLLVCFLHDARPLRSTQLIQLSESFLLEANGEHDLQLWTQTSACQEMRRGPRPGSAWRVGSNHHALFYPLVRMTFLEQADDGRNEELDLGWKSGQDQSMRKRRYTVSDGKIVLTLEEAEEGGYIVTSPLDPELVTEAETVGEAFENAKDTLRALAQSRTKLLRKLQISRTGA